MRFPASLPLNNPHSLRTRAGGSRTLVPALVLLSKGDDRSGLDLAVGLYSTHVSIHPHYEGA